MNYESILADAREALRRSSALGFDALELNVTETTKQGIRLALGSVCRENVLTKAYQVTVTGDWQGRSSTISCPAEGIEALCKEIATLRRDLEQQSPDKEYVPPGEPKGAYSWRLVSQELLEAYPPEVVYPAIERNVARTREKGLRVTGYLELMEQRTATFTASGFSIETRDHGLTLGITVDDPKTGASGVAKRAAVFATALELDRLIGEATREAERLCVSGKDPGTIEPGDYTVILSPSAISDILQMGLLYELFDRRKIAEGRTYLSRAKDDLVFPEGLILAHRQRIEVPGGAYCDMPFNHRMIPCTDLELVRDGRIRDLYTNAFWAKETGHRETFLPTYAPPLVLEARKGSPLAGKHADLEALIGSTERGIYVADTWYIRMVAEMDGTLTGMTRDGLFEIRDGKIVRPLRHMRWHENPLRILSAVDGMTDEKLLLGRSRLSGRGRSLMTLMPAVRVRDFHFSSVTRF